MADYTFTGPTATSKAVLGAVQPSGAIDSAWGRLGPLITATELKSKFLLGIPLYSYVTDPVTGLATAITDENLNNIIEEHVETAEYELGLKIFPLEILERHAWDRALYMSMGYFKLRERPISSISQVLVTSSDVTTEQLQNLTNEQNSNGVLYIIPLEWIDTGLLRIGQLNIVPLTTVAIAGTSSVSPTNSGAAAFLNLLAASRWLPSYFMVKYTVGYPQGNIPKIINRFIGLLSAIDILSQLAATNASNSSSSLGIDALSQGRSTPGPQLYTQRIQDLTTEKEMLKGKIMNYFSRRIFVSNI